MRFCLIIILLLLFPATFFAQQVKKVVGEYIYHAPENISLEQAKRIALERAQIEAIADAFGTHISQHNSTRVSNKNGHSDVDFQSVSSSDVKGEWIETIGEPEYAIKYEQNMLIVKIRVVGKIREIITSQIDLVTQILCNGTTPQFERSEFRSGDEMFLRFQSPVNGYLVVYLLDHTTQTAYCLLPYNQSIDSAQKIEHDKSYLFFSAKDAPVDIRDLVDEYTMTCSGDIEFNDIYILFSPNEFVKANSMQTGDYRPRELPLKVFNEWLVKHRKIDNKLQINNKSLTIKH